jgi:hypothetical protein
VVREKCLTVLLNKDWNIGKWDITNIMTLTVL